MMPNTPCCEGCPSWDDVNGCWRNCQYVCELGYVNDDGYFDSTEYDRIQEGG